MLSIGEFEPLLFLPLNVHGELQFHPFGQLLDGITTGAHQELGFTSSTPLLSGES